MGKKKSFIILLILAILATGDVYKRQGKTYRRGAYSIESAGDGTGMLSEAEYNPVGSYIKKFDLDKELCGKRVRPVSYTHLDVYKRQQQEHHFTSVDTVS